MMKKLKLTVVAGAFALILSGCGSSDYSIIGTQSGPAQETYRLRVDTDMPMSRVEEIAREFKGKHSDKMVMVNFYDGERSVENMIYTCTDGECYDAQPGR